MPLSTFPKNPVVFGVGGTAGNDFWIDGTINEIYFWNRALSKIEVVDSSEGAAVVATVDARIGSPPSRGKSNRNSSKSRFIMGITRCLTPLTKRDPN